MYGTIATFDSMESKSSRDKSGRSPTYPRSAVLLMGLTILQSMTFAAFITTNTTFWIEYLGKSEKYGHDANFALSFLTSFSSLFTGFLADNYIGRYYATGAHILLFFVGFGCMIGAALLDSSISVVSAWIGLTIIATAIGINKVVVPTFNADQFTSDHSKEAKDRIFAWSYLLVNVGAVLAIFGIASQKDLVQCFNRPCYSMMHGTCMLCILITGVIFLMYHKKYIRAPLKSNVVVLSMKCVLYALLNRTDQQQSEQAESGRKSDLQSKSGDPQTHCSSNDESSQLLSSSQLVNKEQPTGTFLDRAYPKYDRKFIADILQVARVGKMFCIGIPFSTCFSVMFGQWVSQFTRTNGQIGPFTANFLAYSTANPIFCVVFIFLLNKLVIPLMKKCVKVTVLRKMAAGGIITVVCACCAVIVEYKLLADDLPPLKTGLKLVFWSEKSLKRCEMFLTESAGIQSKLNYLVENTDLSPGNYSIHSSCSMSFAIDGVLAKSIQLEKGINILALYPGKNSNEAELFLRKTSYEKVRMIRTQVDVMTCRSNAMYLNNVVSPTGFSVKLFSVFLESRNFHLRIGACSRPGGCLEFDVNIEGKLGSKIAFFDEVNCQNRTESIPPTKLVLVSPHTVHFSWMLPQNIIFALAESFLAVAATELAYTQTSTSMKAVAQTLWLQTGALGALLGLALNQFGMSLLTSFYVYAGIMLVGTLVFIVLATFYRFVHEEEPNKTVDS